MSFVERGVFGCVPEEKSVEGCWVLAANNPFRCAVCRVNYFFSNGVCERSASYRVNQGALREDVFVLVFLAILMVAFK